MRQSSAFYKQDGFLLVRIVLSNLYKAGILEIGLQKDVFSNLDESVLLFTNYF